MSRLSLKTRSSLYYLLIASLMLQSTFGTSVDLGTSTTSETAKITCSTASSSLGQSVKAIGDVNGDGHKDFLIGLPGYNSNKGAVVILYGVASGNLPSIDVCTQLTTSYGYMITGDTSDTMKFGYAVSSAGDIDNDGVEEIAVGAPGYYTNSGRVYVIFLPSTPSSASFAITTLTNPTNGAAGSYYMFSGATGASEKVGTFVTNVGDVNNDNIPDILIACSAIGSNQGGFTVLFGSTTATDHNLATITSTEGYRVNGVTNEYVGDSGAACGALNSANSIPSMLLGASTANKVYVLYGVAGSGNPVNLISFPTGGLTLHSATKTIGKSISCGDINGDGVVDAVIGTKDGYSVYVVFGTYLKTLSAGTTVELDSMTSTQGFIISGDTTNTGTTFGTQVAATGDVNGDGVVDILVTSTNVNSSSGAAYLIYGAKTGLVSFSMSDFNSTQGINITGPTGSQLGDSIDASKDLNGDGYNDIIIGNVNSGAAYIVYGKDFPEDATTITKVSSKLTGGQIAGIVIGSVCGTIVIGVAIFLTLTKTSVGTKIATCLAKAKAKKALKSAAKGAKGKATNGEHVQIVSSPTEEAVITLPNQA